MNYNDAKEIMDNLRKIPYPLLQNIRKNSNYANLLYEDYAGPTGELTAITTYVYQNMALNYGEDINKIVLDIAKIEMIHLDKIGTLIKILGKEPYYISSNDEYWNARNVNYNTRHLKEVIKENIKAEEIAIYGYNKAKRYTANPSIIKLLNRIIMDEESHKKIFTEILRDID